MDGYLEKGLNISVEMKMNRNLSATYKRTTQKNDPADFQPNVSTKVEEIISSLRGTSHNASTKTQIYERDCFQDEFVQVKNKEIIVKRRVKPKKYLFNVSREKRKTKTANQTSSSLKYVISSSKSRYENRSRIPNILAPRFVKLINTPSSASRYPSRHKTSGKICLRSKKQKFFFSKITNAPSPKRQFFISNFEYSQREI